MNADLGNRTFRAQATGHFRVTILAIGVLILLHLQYEFLHRLVGNAAKFHAVEIKQVSHMLIRKLIEIKERIAFNKDNIIYL